MAQMIYTHNHKLMFYLLILWGAGAIQNKTIKDVVSWGMRVDLLS